MKLSASCKMVKARIRNITAFAVLAALVFTAACPAATWLPTSSMHIPRQFNTATLLPNGKVLVAGGEVVFSVATNTVELYDPATDSWTPTGSMSANRENHT